MIEDFQLDFHSKYIQKNNINKISTIGNIANSERVHSLYNVTGKDVTHRNGNPRDNRYTNLGIASVKRNRSFARTKTAGKVRSRA